MTDKHTLIIFDYRGTLYKQGRIVHGMDEVIKEAAKKHTLAIVSFSAQKEIQTALKNEGLLSYFSTIKTCSNRDSKESAMKELAEEHETPLKHCLFITDTHDDIQAAKASGITGIFVTWGDESELPDNRETMVVRSPAELSSLLKHFFQE